MQVIIFFKTVEGLSDSVRAFRSQLSPGIEILAISSEQFGENEIQDMKQLSCEITIVDTMEEALTHTASFVRGDMEVVISLDSVYPVSGWFNTLEEQKKHLPKMSVAFGRWYRTVIPEREYLSNKSLGFKFIDNTPLLIAQYIIDQCPNPDIHCKQVSRFPLFINWFSKDTSLILRSCLDTASGLSDLSRFVCDFADIGNEALNFYYLPALESIDRQLLK